MTKTVIFNDSTYDALCDLFAPVKIALPAAELTEVRRIFVKAVVTDPPSPLPTGDLAAQVKAAAIAAGFSKAMFYDWDWANPAQFVQTYNDAQGGSHGPNGPQAPLGQNGVVVIAFRPVAIIGNGSLSVVEYPGGLGTRRKTSISTKPCDFSLPLPWTREGYNAGIQFVVGGASRTSPVLQTGTQYFLNVCNVPDPTGKPLDQPEVRINATRPQLA